MSNSAQVSVVVTCYNYGHYLEGCIRSVLAQTFDDFEIIVIDDGSTDDTLKMTKKILDPRLRIIHQKNAGLSAARNTGIQNSKGKYIALLDGDDIWFEEYAERNVNALEADNCIGITHTFLAYIDDIICIRGVFHYQCICLNIYNQFFDKI